MPLVALATLAKIRKEPKYPLIDEWIKIHLHIYICTYVHSYTHTHILEYYSAIKQWNVAVCNNMGGAEEYKPKQNVRERQIWCDFTNMWTLRNKTKEQRGTKRETLQETHSYLFKKPGGYGVKIVGDGWNQWWGEKSAFLVMSTKSCTELLALYIYTSNYCHIEC